MWGDSGFVGTDVEIFSLGGDKRYPQPRTGTTPGGLLLLCQAGVPEFHLAHASLPRRSSPDFILISEVYPYSPLCLIIDVKLWFLAIIHPL